MSHEPGRIIENSVIMPINNSSGSNKRRDMSLPEIQRLAERGDVTALFVLALCYLTGDGVPIDLQKAHSLLQRAAEQGMTEAQYELGGWYASGMGVSVDVEQARHWFELAAAQGDSNAQLSLAMLNSSQDSKDPDVRLDPQLLGSWAEKGNVEAQYELGLCYLLGTGVPQDEAMGSHWIREAAQGGHAGAQDQFGSLLKFGALVTKDVAEAALWYERAALQGHASAQVHLALCYLHGEGVTRDMAKAFAWLSKAAEAGNALGQLHLGDCYYEGKGTERDVVMAFKWYQKAAEQGHALAQLKLGDCHMSGLGTTKDETVGFYWHAKALESAPDEVIANHFAPQKAAELARRGIRAPLIVVGAGILTLFASLAIFLLERNGVADLDGSKANVVEPRATLYFTPEYAELERSHSLPNPSRAGAKSEQIPLAEVRAMIERASTSTEAFAASRANYAPEYKEEVERLLEHRLQALTETKSKLGVGAKTDFYGAELRDQVNRTLWFKPRMVSELRAGKSSISQIEWSMEGDYVYALDRDGILYKWATVRGQLEWSVKGLSGNGGLSLSPSGHHLLVAEVNGNNVVILDAQSGRVVHTLAGHKGLLNSLVYSRNGGLVASCAEDATARIWEMPTGRQRYCLAHDGAVYTAVFSDDGKYLATACANGTAALWDVESGKKIRSWGPFESPVRCVDVSEQGLIVITAARGSVGKIVLSPLVDGNPKVLESGRMFERALFLPGGKEVLAADFNGAIRVLACNSGRALVEMTGYLCEQRNRPARHDMLTTFDMAGGIHVWGMPFGRRIGFVPETSRLAEFSNDGTMLLTVHPNNTLRLWREAKP